MAADPHAAALRYARAGLPVLPLHTPTGDGRCSCRHDDCDRPGKHPRWHPRLILNGLHDATTDPNLIREWWTRWPDANIGIRTGVLVDVCDVDDADGVRSLRRLAGDQLAGAPLVQSGSGGWHLYLAATGFGNRVRILPGVDWRGRNGSIVAPPSLHHTGRRYRWVRPLVLPAPACPPPLLALLTPPERPGTGRSAAGRSEQPIRDLSRYAAAALSNEVHRVASAVPGTRNTTLFHAARSLGRLAGSGGQAGSGALTDREITDALTEAARGCGLFPREIRRAIHNGLYAGRRQAPTSLSRNDSR